MVVDVSGDEGAAAPDPLRIDVRIVFRNPRCCESADHSSHRAAGNRACGRADGCRDQPARRDNGPHPGNGHEAQAGEEASAAANSSPHTRAFARITSGIGCAVITIYRHDVVGDDANIGVRNAGGFELSHGCGRVHITIEKPSPHLSVSCVNPLMKKATHFGMTFPW